MASGFSGGWSAQRMLVIALAGGLLFRLWLSAVFPFTGDEAYFVDWGRHPDWGFYDHPPMVGWWLAARTPLSLRKKERAAPKLKI